MTIRNFNEETLTAEVLRRMLGRLTEQARALESADKEVQ